MTLWYLLLSAMHLIKQWLCQNCVWYLFTQRDASKLSLVSFNQRDASNGRTFNWKLSVWYLFLRAKYVFSIPFMSMMESTKVSAMLLMEERLLTENCLWYLFLRAKYVFSIPFMSMMESTKVRFFFPLLILMTCFLFSSLCIQFCSG